MQTKDLPDAVLQTIISSDPGEQALERTGVSADDVSYVNAHGTSTPVGDMAEYRCLTSTLENRH